METFVAEMECLASVSMVSGNAFSLLKFEDGSIRTDWKSSLFEFERGELYEVTFRKVNRSAAPTENPTEG